MHNSLFSQNRLYIIIWGKAKNKKTSRKSTDYTYTIGSLRLSSQTAASSFKCVLFLRTLLTSTKAKRKGVRELFWFQVYCYGLEMQYLPPKTHILKLRCQMRDSKKYTGEKGSNFISINYYYQLSWEKCFLHVICLSIDQVNLIWISRQIDKQHLRLGRRI